VSQLIPIASPTLPALIAAAGARHSERSPTWRVAKSSADRDASLTLRWREMDSNPRSPVGTARFETAPFELSGCERDGLLWTRPAPAISGNQQTACHLVAIGKTGFDPLGHLGARRSSNWGGRV
jgi:hypothetical protein